MCNLIKYTHNTVLPASCVKTCTHTNPTCTVSASVLYGREKCSPPTFFLGRFGKDFFSRTFRKSKTIQTWYWRPYQVSKKSSQIDTRLCCCFRVHPSIIHERGTTAKIFYNLPAPTTRPLMCTLYCTLYFVLCTFHRVMCCVHCTVYLLPCNVLCTLYCVPFTVICVVYTVLCTL